MKRDSASKLNVGSLCRDDVKVMFQADIQQKLIISPCNDDPNPDTLWDDLKSAILKTIADVLGYTNKNNRDWINKNNKEIAGS